MSEQSYFQIDVKENRDERCLLNKPAHIPSTALEALSLPDALLKAALENILVALTWLMLEKKHTDYPHFEKKKFPVFCCIILGGESASLREIQAPSIYSNMS